MALMNGDRQTSVGNEDGLIACLTMGVQMGYLQASICHLICHHAESLQHTTHTCGVLQQNSNNLIHHNK